MLILFVCTDTRLNLNSRALLLHTDFFMNRREVPWEQGWCLILIISFIYTFCCRTSIDNSSKYSLQFLRIWAFLSSLNIQIIIIIRIIIIITIILIIIIIITTIRRRRRRGIMIMITIIIIMIIVIILMIIKRASKHVESYSSTAKNITCSMQKCLWPSILSGWWLAMRGCHP